MLLKTPKFWSKRNIFSWLMMPLSLIYYLLFNINKLYQLSKAYKPRARVICIGNLTTGGAGKTPVAIAIAKFLLGHKVSCVFLTKGYGGKFEGPLKVNGTHNARQVGDEALLLNKVADTYLAKNRIEGVKFAEKHGAKVIIMDDGLQNYSVIKDLSIVVIDGNYGFGNGLLMPAGPMRESTKSLTKADLIIIIGENKIFNIDLGKKLIKATIKPLIDLELLKQPLVAFCGLAIPDKFMTTLNKLNCQIVASEYFPDHYNYTEEDIIKLKQLASFHNAKLITTEKDAVRLRPELLQDVIIMPIELYFENTDHLTKILSCLKH